MTVLCAHLSRNPGILQIPESRSPEMLSPGLRKVGEMLNDGLSMLRAMRSPTARAEVLIEALPFIQKFRGALFVVKYGGSAMDDAHIVERFLRDIVFLEAVGINPVLIHGGGKAIT